MRGGYMHVEFNGHDAFMRVILIGQENPEASIPYSSHLSENFN